MIIKCLSDNETVCFAAEELEKYLDKLDCNIMEDFAIELAIAKLGDPDMDTVDIHISEEGGYLHGSNPRSVLYAVYRYLEELGVRWLWHGEGGEYLPDGVSVSQTAVSLRSSAGKKYRGLCIEGAVSIENMLDNIDWAAKLGYNTYFIQFTAPHFFFEMWYTHKYNPTLEKQPISYEDVVEYKRRMVTEIKKRGMIFQDVGHGWTLRPFGITEDNHSTVIPDHLKDIFAKVPGVRSIQDSQLCYSKPYVREKIVEYVVSYATEHPESDVLVFCLADGEHNHCECEVCTQKRPSDWYFMLLNEIDEAMTKAKLTTKICFDAYVDLLWLPRYENIRKKERFILMFAPIGRDYLTSYAEAGEIPEEEAYVLNKMELPIDVESNIGYYRRMHEYTGIDSFAFEYYYWRGGEEHYGDFGGINLAKLVHKDLSVIGDLGLQGMMSCQTQRSFMPTGIGNFVMARNLWDEKLSYEAIEKEYFSYAFGDHCDRIIGYLTELSNLSKGDLKLVLSKAEEILDYLGAVDQSALKDCQKKAVFYLKFHAGKLIKYTAAELKSKESSIEGARTEWLDFLKYIRENELAVQSVFDLFLYLNFLASKHGELEEIFMSK